MSMPGDNQSSDDGDFNIDPQKTVTFAEMLQEFIYIVKKKQYAEEKVKSLENTLNRNVTSNKKFDKASKEWNSLTLQGRVSYIDDRYQRIFMEQSYLTFKIDVSETDITNQIYKIGDVLMVVGRIKMFKEDSEDDGMITRGDILVEPYKIISISNGDDIVLPD